MTFCPLCKTLGLSKLVVSKDGKAKKLYSRLEKDNFQTPLLKEGMAKCYGLEKSGKYINQECRPKKIFIENYEIHGRNVAALSIFDLADLLLQKDFPQIANFNKERRFGPIFLPNNFIPKIPKSKNFENQGEIPNQRKGKKFPGAIGDSVERQVFETLKSHFLPKRDENVIIIQGMNTVKVEKILKGSLDLMPSPSPLVKIQIMGGKVCLRCKGVKHCWVFCFLKFVDNTQQGFAFMTFLSMI